ncbi:MAG: type IV pilus twitching motility protein PilT [Fibrobacterales bacterium]
MNIRELLEHLAKEEGSDLHLTVGTAPMIRKSGRLEPVGDEKLSAESVTKLIFSVMNEAQRKTFEEKNEADFSFGVKDLARFRANIYMQRGCAAAAIRIIPYEVVPFEELGLPDTVLELATRPSGLILVVGATGSGKSTTLSSMIDHINETTHGHILTIEDPIEFVHKHKNCIVNQREVNADTESFSGALKYALRQDPDVVLIGEMRDIETIRSALTIAETGHLTFATLHTNSAAQTISRIVNSFGSDEQQTVRTQLSFVLQGVICQQLVPTADGGRALAYEILTATHAVSALIRDDKVHQLESTMETSQKYGMNTMNMRLAEMVKSGVISEDVAFNKTNNADQLQQLLHRF